MVLPIFASSPVTTFDIRKRASDAGSTPPPAPTPTPVALTDAQIAHNWRGPLTVGMNIDRVLAWNGDLTYNGVNIYTNKPYYDYLKNLGLTWIRYFMPYRGDRDMGLGRQGNNTPSAGQIDVMLNCIDTAISAGLKVQVDWMDVISSGEINTYRTAIDAYLDLVGQRIAARAYDPKMLCVGPVNEYQGGINADYNQIRKDFHNILRNRLPAFVLSTGAARWCSLEGFLEPNSREDGSSNGRLMGEWEMVSDQKVICNWHQYYYTNSTGFWNGIQNQWDSFLANHGGIPSFAGEIGYDDFEAGHMQYSQRWLDHMNTFYSSNAGLQRGAQWVITTGNDYRANRAGNDARITPALENLISNNNQQVRAVPGWKEIPFPGTTTDGTGTTTPPPPPASTQPHDPPSNYVAALIDDFTMPATWGVDALDESKWRIRGYDNYQPNNTTAKFSRGAMLESTGNSIRIHTKWNNSTGEWDIDGFQESGGNTGESWHSEGRGECHVRFRARYSHGYAPGVGGYALLWPAANDWSSEIDILEMPSAETGGDKTIADATVHFSPGGGYDLGSDHSFDVAKMTGVNLSQYHIWDMRRTYETVDGDVQATVRVWIDGVEMDAPSSFQSNSFLDENMVFGAATYVGYEDNWYGRPNGDTPNESFFELDYVYIYVPGSGAVTQTITINNSPGTLTETTAGQGADWTASISTTGSLTALEYAVFNSSGVAYTNWVAFTLSTNPMGVLVRMRNTGDVLKVRKSGDSGIMATSTAVTLTTEATTGPGSKSISIVPYSPGNLTETSPGAGATWNTTITTQNIARVAWVVVQPGPSFAWRQPVFEADTTGSVNISVTFLASGEFVKAMDASDYNIVTDSGTATIGEATPEPGGRSLGLSPNDPGSRAAGVWNTSIISTGITRVGWVVVGPAPSYAWTTSPNELDTTGTVNISPEFTQSGQFVKVMDMNDTAYTADSGNVTII